MIARVIPVLLVRGTRLVKTISFSKERYVGDVLNAVKIFNDKEVDELIVLDIDASVKGETPNFELIEELASECFMPLCYGGGLNDLDSVARVFDAGIEKVSFNAALYSAPELISKVSQTYGSQSVVASIDAKKQTFGRRYGVWTHSAGKKQSFDPVGAAKYAEGLGVGEILLNSIDRDGGLCGYDLELVKQVSAAVSIPLIACGGAASIKDFRLAIHEAGASAIAAGSMFVFYGKLQAVLINVPSPEELAEELSC